MKVPADTLEFLDLRLKFDKESKQMSADVFAKDTNSFPKSNIESVPKGVALCLKWIWDSDEEFEKHSSEYQNYLITRDYKPGEVKKKQQLSDIKKLKKKQENLNYTSTSCNSIT